MARLAVLTSGGDAPGMNAALRAVVRGGLAAGHDMFGVRHGYTGLVSGELVPMGTRDVAGILGRAGTVLGSSRCPEMRTEAGLHACVRNLAQFKIDLLITIGGNGTQTGALALKRIGVPVVGIASTIDNDLVGSEPTIGAMSALAVALEAIDRLRATASAHQRAFLVEVMGRDSGHLALMAAVAGGAEAVCLPERASEPAAVAVRLREAYARGKPHAIVVVAEGATPDAEGLKAHFAEHHDELGFQLRVTRLGHVQRGGEPSPFDRLMATRLGAAAIDRISAGERGMLMGWLEGRPASTPLEQAAGVIKSLDADLLRLTDSLV